MKKLRVGLLSLVILAFVVSAPRARAMDVGDAALTVGISSAVGAILGLSTLPFYEDSSAHTRNIWIGAAVGAVIGVGIASFSALKNTDPQEFEDDYEEADKQDFSLITPGNVPTLAAPASSALPRGKQNATDVVAFHAPVKIFSF